jgi:hypothetical protein
MRRLGLCLLLAILILSACSSNSLQNKITGSWVNTAGYSMEFHSDGSGVFPGVTGVLPDTPFKYSIVDESHISITMNGQTFTIGVKVDGDKLTWQDSMGNEVYTRVKK